MAFLLPETIIRTLDLAVDGAHPSDLKFYLLPTLDHIALLPQLVLGILHHELLVADAFEPQLYRPNAEETRGYCGNHYTTYRIINCLGGMCILD